MLEVHLQLLLNACMYCCFQEMEGLARTGVVFYGINLSVGLSVSVPGFATDMAHGLLGEMPFGTISLVGVLNPGDRLARHVCQEQMRC